MASSLLRIISVLIILLNAANVAAQWPSCDEEDEGDDDGWIWFKRKTPSISTSTRTASPGFSCASKTFKQTPDRTSGPGISMPRPGPAISTTATPWPGTPELIPASAPPWAIPPGTNPASASWTPQPGNSLIPTFLSSPFASSSSIASAPPTSDAVTPSFTVVGQSQLAPAAQSPQVVPSTPNAGDVPKSLNSKDVIASSDSSFMAIAGSDPTIELVDKLNSSGDTLRQSGYAYQGGVWIPERSEIWFTSEKSQQPSNLYVLDMLTNLVSRPVLSHAISNAIGGHYHDGVIYWAALGDPTRRPGIYSVQARTGNVQEVMLSYQGKPLNGPRDVTVFTTKGKASAIYFSEFTSFDSVSSSTPATGTDSRLSNTIYKFEFDSGITKPLIPADRINAPKGICISADQKRIYVAQAPLDPRAPDRAIYSFSLDANGDADVGSKTLFASAVAPGIQDGLKCDDLGNVWSAEGGGIVVRNAAGKQLGGFKSLPMKVAMAASSTEIANFALAGDQLFVLALDRIWRIQLAKAVVSPGRYNGTATGGDLL